MLANATRWIRRHPVRCAVYVLLTVGVVWGALTARGILRGERNPLLTRVARSAWLRGWVEREFRVRYSIEAVSVFPKCGFEVEVRGVNPQKAEEVNVGGTRNVARACAEIGAALLYVSTDYV